MAGFPNKFSNVTTAQTPWLDQNFNFVGSLVWTPCAVTGTNTLTFTPAANSPSVTAYSQGLVVAGIAAGANTTSVVANVAGVGTANVYKDTIAGPVILTGNEIQPNNQLILTYDPTLNGSAGGFHLVPSYSAPYLSSAFGNRLRNPDFNITQRTNATFTITTGSAAYHTDGWISQAAGANVTLIPNNGSQQAAGGLGANSVKIVGASSNTQVNFYQRIEASWAAPMAGQQVVFQIKLTNNTGGTLTPSISAQYPNTMNAFGGVTTDLVITAVQSIANGATGTIAYSWTASPSAVLGYRPAIYFPLSASTQTVTLFDADFRVAPPPAPATGLVSSPPTPEFRPPATELAINQRYLPKVSGIAQSFPFIGQATSTSIVLCSIPFPVTPFNQATGISQTGTASHFAALNAQGTIILASSLAFNSSTQAGALVQFTVAASLTAGNASACGWTSSGTSADAILFTGAEL